MANRDEGALKTVGWGPFALPGERKRLRAAEERRLAEVEATSAPDDAVSSSSEAITPAMSLQRINEMLRSKSTEVMWLCNVSRLHLTKLGDASDQEIRDAVSLIRPTENLADIDGFDYGTRTADIPEWAQHPSPSIGAMFTQVSYGSETITLQLSPETVSRYASLQDLREAMEAAIRTVLKGADSQK